ncbi:GNAT family N-acetyltransferase [Atopomonas sediminilitoris]|uniref:GNAT family N-acetyltransferase n=1 Tax=Atopomonas sediminilitoris TaxID=2919919 RepID=UPI001F4D9D4E|nr:GNAT family N-acetyltransferase [Atopomonas sediminilitoris]
MHVRKAEEADVAALVPLFAAYLSFYERPAPLKDIRAFLAERLQHREAMVLLAYEGEALLGFALLYPFFASLHLRPAWLLHDMYVANQVRRQGVGKCLLQAVSEQAVAAGVCGVQLETANSNVAAQNLYEQLGYVRDQEFRTYWLALAPATVEE